ncbi:hypothetical protein SAMN05428965_3485 [Geodermatophilus sp. DSM 45219]|nr:hypothetical protein SAMN05428965_3485 [Geodermatophilus sp. DSM 45219]
MLEVRTSAHGRAFRHVRPAVPGWGPCTDAISFGKAGLQGWRAKLADAVARPVARTSGLSDDRVRAVIGGVFSVPSVVHVAQTVERLTAGS